MLWFGMLATKAQERAVPATGYSYAAVETALARVFQIDAAGQVGWLRGRIQHLRRLGLTPPANRGPVAYTDDWVARWLLALRLENLGLNPVAIVGFITDNWERKPGDELPVESLLDVVAKARKARKPDDTEDVWLTVVFDFRPGKREFPRIGNIQPYRKAHLKQNNAQGFFNHSRANAVDQVAIPLSEILRRLDVELNVAAQERAKTGA